MSDYSPHLIIPGWGGSGEDHWQSYWERDLYASRIVLDDWNAAVPARWLAAIELAVAELAQRDPRPPVLVAHSLGCIAVAQWARTTRHAVRAALLVAPADVERGTCQAKLAPFAPIARTPLPFPSLVIASDDDPCVDLDRAREFATAWGSGVHAVRSGGHLNAASGLGRWRLGRALLAELLSRTDLALSA